MTLAQFKAAIDNNDLDFVRASIIEHPEYLETKISWNSGYYNDYPLIYATVTRRTDVMRLLVNEFGVNVNRQDGNSQKKAAMHYAAEYAVVNSITTLLELGAEVSPCDESGRTPLDLCNNADAQKKLIAAITTRWQKKKELKQKLVAQNDDKAAAADQKKSGSISGSASFKKQRSPSP